MTTRDTRDDDADGPTTKVKMPFQLPEFYPFKSMDDAAKYNPHQSPFRTKPTCAVCFAERGNDGSTLKKCSRCSLVHYCSRDHQAHDYKKSHKDTCRTFAELDQLIPPKKQRALDIHNKNNQDDDQEWLSCFASYVDAVLERCHLVHSVVRQHKSLALAEQLAMDYIDYFTHDDPDDVRRKKARLGFLLLELGRDADAVRLCRFWFLSDHDTEFIDTARADQEYETFFRPIFQARSDCPRGQWCYGYATNNYGTQEIVENCWEGVRYPPQDMDTLLLLVICIAKMKLVLRSYSMIGKYSAYTESTIGKRLEQEKSINALIKSMIFGHDETSSQAFQDLKRVQKQIPDLLRLIHDHNAILLPAIINPEPFKEQIENGNNGAKHSHSKFEHQQVTEALHYARDLLIHGTPGALTYLQNALGIKPKYFI
jgi:MYND finger